MNVETVNELIDELETAETSLSNIRNLSALYIVKSHMIGTDKFDPVAKELNDILPSYITYVDVKRRYQLHEVPQDAILISLKNVCREIEEFIKLLYSGFDVEEEKIILQNMIQKILI